METQRTSDQDPVALVVSRLPSPRQQGDEWRCRCPAHDGRADDSLSVTRGDNGGAVLHCFSGCSPDAVCRAVGLTLADLMPEDAARPPASNGQPRPKKSARTYVLPRNALAALDQWMGRSDGKRISVWQYCDRAGQAVAGVVRYDLPTPPGSKQDKTFRPVSRHPDGWRLADPPGKWPLYRLPELLAEPGNWVCIVEGEKAADAAASIGLTVVTSAHGASSPGKTDWGPLAGREAVILPDNDSAGAGYADAVAAKLVALTPPAAVRVLRLPDLPAGGDIADWLDARDAVEPSDLRDEVMARAADAAQWTPPAGPVRLAPGTVVRAGDRGNYGTVVRDNGPTVTVHFVSDSGKTATADLPREQISPVEGSDASTVDAAARLDLRLIDSRTFDDTQYDQTFLVKNILVAKQPGLIGGKYKTLKTSLAVDLALSVGSGTHFLGQFEAKQARVMMLSGESGAFTLQETARRIADARGTKLADADILWGFILPQIARGDHLDVLAETIIARGVGLAIIDPAYLCLLGGDTKGRQASNLFDMGPLLLGLSDVMDRTGATIVMAHHCRKNTANGADAYAVPELEDLSMSGFAEWARQWLLLGRREPYEQGSGAHRLWLNVGGSAGHSGCWGLDIEEGQLADDFGGRRWEVSVEGAGEARKAAAEKREHAKIKSQERWEDARRRKLVEIMRRYPLGETANILRQAAGLSGKNFGDAIAVLLKRGEAESCVIEKKTGSYEGFRLTAEGNEK